MYGLLGKTLSHSFSKKIHEALGTSYQLIESSDLELFFDITDFNGLNVTIPYKEDVIEYCDVIDPLVTRTKSCNTIVKKSNTLYAYNTDYAGFLSSLLFHRISLQNQTVGIIGNGATSRTVQAVAKDLGAKTIYVFGRHPRKDECLLDTLSTYKDITVLINTTPVGMHPNIHDSLPIELSSFVNLNSVIDVVYNPLRTKLLLRAEELGLQTMNGLYMLVAQAVKSYELFHQKSIKEKQVHILYRSLKKQQSNIVLIGMPKSGKSLYSKIYSDKMNRKLYDTDTLFETKFKMSISDYFTQNSEQSFRHEEQKIIQNIASQSGVVISTGGGSVLVKENVINLKLNGVIIFIDAPLNLLENTGQSNHRPLLKNATSLQKLYKERHHLYTDAADIILTKETLHTSTNINALEVLIYEYFGT
jgi:shikimate dehydrogenase